LPNKITQYKYIRRGTVAGCQRRLTIATVNNFISKQIAIQTKFKQ